MFGGGGGCNIWALIHAQGLNIHKARHCKGKWVFQEGQAFGLPEGAAAAAAGGRGKEQDGASVLALDESDCKACAGLHRPHTCSMLPQGKKRPQTCSKVPQGNKRGRGRPRKLAWTPNETGGGGGGEKEEDEEEDEDGNDEEEEQEEEVVGKTWGMKVGEAAADSEKKEGKVKRAHRIKGQNTTTSKGSGPGGWRPGAGRPRLTDGGQGRGGGSQRFWANGMWNRPEVCTRV